MRILLVMAIAVLAVTAVRADEQKIAVIDMRSIMSAHPEMAAVESAMEKKMEEFRTEKTDYQDQFDKMKKELEEAHEASENKALSEEARTLKKKQVEEKLFDLKQFQAKMNETLKTRKDQIEEQGLRMQKNIVEKVSGIVGEYAKKQNLKMVINSQVVVYNDDVVDITDEILEMITKAAKTE